MLRHGIPPEIVTALRAVSAGFRALGLGRRGHAAAAADGGELELRDRTLRVLHRPGHSPSDTVFLDESRSILLAADHLIAHISSNPLLARPLDASRRLRPAPRPQALIDLHGLAREDARDGARAGAARATAGRSPTTSR